MKIRKLKKGQSVHTATREEAKAICKLMTKAGLFVNSEWWDEHHVNTVYNSDGTFSSLKYAISQRYTIFPATIFLKHS